MRARKDYVTKPGKRTEHIHFFTDCFSNTKLRNNTFVFTDCLSNTKLRNNTLSYYRPKEEQNYKTPKKHQELNTHSKGRCKKGTLFCDFYSLTYRTQNAKEEQIISTKALARPCRLDLSKVVV